MTARSCSIIPVSACVLALLTAPAHGARLSPARVVSGVDWTSAGVGGVSVGGAGIIPLMGVSGTVKQAFLYWHGIDEPEAGGDGVYDNEAVTFAGHPVVGTPVGDSGANCWPTVEQSTGSSRTIRAEVTAFVSGNGGYTVSGLSAKPGHSADGASLIVFFDDGNFANDRDVVVFEGNDANRADGFPGEDDGWHATLNGIHYSGGSVNAQLHVADGRMFPDNVLTFTTTAGVVSIPDTTSLWDGTSVADAGTSRADNGSLWDIHSLDVTGAFGAPARYSLSMDGQEFVGNDCLGLVVLLLDFPAGSLPAPTTTSTTSTTTSTMSSTTSTLPPHSCGNGTVDPGEECDLGAAANGTPAACCTATCVFGSASQECRPAADACDVAETCSGSSATCPADARKNVGDVCDDGDPDTGISSCNDAQVCTGVSTIVTLQPETRVPPRRNRKRVRIPLRVAVPDRGSTQARALAEGLVACRDVPPGFRQDCGRLPVLLRVTLRVKRSLGARQTRSVSMDLPLTKFGRKLFEQLGSSDGGLTVQVRCRLRDRQGREIDVTAPTVLKRQQ